MRFALLFAVLALAAGCASPPERVGQAPIGPPDIVSPAPSDAAPLLPPLPDLEAMGPDERALEVYRWSREALAGQGRSAEEIEEAIPFSAVVEMAAAPMAAVAAPPEEWPERTWVEWTHPHPERISRVQFSVKPQGYTWFSAVSSRPSERPIVLGGDFITALRGSWEGCAEVRGKAYGNLEMLEDGTLRVPVSPITNVIVSGECLDPAPTPIDVPEPGRGQLMAGGLLALFVMLARRRDDRMADV